MRKIDENDKELLVGVPEEQDLGDPVTIEGYGHLEPVFINLDEKTGIPKSKEELEYTFDDVLILTQDKARGVYPNTHVSLFRGEKVFHYTFRTYMPQPIPNTDKYRLKKVEARYFIPLIEKDAAKRYFGTLRQFHKDIQRAG